MMAKLEQVYLRGVVVLLAGLALAAPATVFGQAITAVSTVKNAGNNADSFQDGLTQSYQRTSTVGTLSNNGTVLRVRYAEVVGADAGAFSNQGESMSSDYTINFNATAPVSYELTVTTSLNGAFTLTDDGGGDASANATGVTGTQTGGTVVSGGLTLSDPGSLSGGGGGNTGFHVTSTARIRGTSNGVAQPHTLRFTWSASCQSSSGSANVDGGDECAFRLGIPIAYSGETAGDYPGAGGRTQANDGHFVTVSIISLCGNGTLDQAEECDLGANNGLATTCCTSDCQFRASGASCRPAAGDCDLAEVCNGTSSGCPADVKKASGTVCRAAVFECDLQEVCNGTSTACPADAKKAAGTPCTADSNPCTLDRCDGTNVTCQHPAGNAGTLCRSANGVCDVAENCNGTSTACPADAKRPSGFVCRSAAGTCDQVESCNGTGNNCPADAFKPLGTSCRVPAGPCDNEEFCNGVQPDCGPDSAAGAFVVCRSAVGACDQAENCNGVNVTCPADAKRPSGAVCRSSAGACDLVETCNGTSDTCPGDAFRASTFVCRSAGGECDLAENCTGSGAACPGDAKQASGTPCTADSNPCSLDQCNGSSNVCQHPAGNGGTVCRSAAGVCDVAESCTGTITVCPADAKSTAVCRSAAGSCDVAESCDGVGNNCPADAVKSSGILCRSSAGICDPAEVCDGSSTACPADSVSGAFVVCRPTAGDCDLPENCDGVNVGCPGDGVRASGFVCRSAAGECDLSEACSGSGAACPSDAKKSSGTACTADASLCTLDQCDGSSALCQHPAGNAGTVCRSSAGICDVSESCNGTGTSCPADAFEPSSTVCRGAADQCDVAENCTGSGASCPGNGFQPNGTSCVDGDACTVDTCQSGSCVGVHDIDACLDDFQCYKVRTTRSTPAFVPMTNLSLADAIESGLFDVKKVKHLCPPANRNNQGIVDAVTHEASYQIKPSIGQPVHVKHTNIVVTNEIGTLHLDTVKADLLLVPTLKDLTNPVPNPPNPSAHNVDHYKCYKTRTTKGQAKFPKGLQVSIADQFTAPAVTYDLKAVKHLCYPVDKNSEGIKNASRLLVCYKVKPALGQPLHLKRTGVYINNQFGALRLDTTKEELLCVPSEL